MSRRILIIQGHPDPAGGHYLHALAGAYESAAEVAGHDVRVVDVAKLAFPLIRTREQFHDEHPPESIQDAQRSFIWAEHLVLCYPLWLGTMPALLKGFLEQLLRPGFAADTGGPGHPWKKRLSGRSARIVVTMGMPALIYRWYFGAYSLKSLERNVLGFAGIGPIRETLIGNVEAPAAAARMKWLARMSALGREGG